MKEAIGKRPISFTLLGVLSGFALLILFGNLLLILWGSITNYDSLTCHLARVKYYLQFGKVGYFGANYWAQDIHPTNLTYIHILFYKLFSGWENAFLLVQYLSFLLISWFTYQISIRIFNSKELAGLSALLLFLFVNPVVQSATSQNDLFLTLILTFQIYVTVSRWSFTKKLYWLTGLLFFGMGVKQTFILYQPVVVVFFLYFNRNLKEGFYKTSVLKYVLFVVIFFPLLLSYLISNYVNLGNVNGFPDVISHHSFSEKSLVFILKAGFRNLFRYFFDFITLDGLNGYPGIADYIQRLNDFVKSQLYQVVRLFLGDLEKGPEIRLGFFYLKRLSMEDSSSFWGPIGPLLVLPAGFYSLLRFFRHGKDNKVIPIILSMILVVLAQSFSSYYDMWRGRYFNEIAPFACLITGHFIYMNWGQRVPKIYIAVGLFLSMMATFGAVYLRHDRTILFHRNPISIFESSRNELITEKNKDFIHIIDFISALPPNADSIGLYTTENMPEYLLFDRKTPRAFFPLNSYQRPSPWKHLRMDAFLFTENILSPKPTDLRLGAFGVSGGVSLYYRENQIR